MDYFSVAVLAVIQGFAELLPVSSSAHVIVAGRFLGWNPSSPEGAFLLVMLHTGTMFAVLLHFWPRWKTLWTGNEGGLTPWQFLRATIIATACTGVLGLVLKELIEKVLIAQILMPGAEKAEIEHLFSNLPLIGAALMAAGILTLWAGLKEGAKKETYQLSDRHAALMGLVQGVCLPFRGFSRSGATISTGMLIGVSKHLVEDFSFALAVVLTPPVILRELYRMHKASLDVGLGWSQISPGLFGMVFSFGAGIIALRWLSSWIDAGRWKFFGYYCIAASMVVWAVDALT